MKSMGSEPNATANEETAHWLYFGTPEEAETAPNSLQPGVDSIASDTAVIDAQEAGEDLRPTQALPAQPTSPPETAPQPKLDPEVRNALLRELLSRSARRVAAMLALTVAVTWLSGNPPEAVPVVVIALLLAALTVLAEFGAWFATGKPTDAPLLIPTGVAWLAGLFTLALFVTPQQGEAIGWLAAFGAGYLAGLAVQTGLCWLQITTLVPVLPSRPLTLGLVLMTAALAPTLHAIFGEQLLQANAWAAQLVSWLIPTLPTPWPWHPALSWALAVATATFLANGTYLARAPLAVKAPTFLAALALTIWSFLAHPAQSLIFALIWAVLAVFALGRR